MADKKTCSESNALAAALLTMDEEVAQRYVEQIAGMNALEKAWDTAVLNIARAQLNGMINATILKDWAGGIAKKRLVEQMAKSNIGTKKYITDMLNTLDKFKTAVANWDGMQTLYNVLDVSRWEWEAMFGWAIDSLLTHFSNKYALNETYDVLDETLRSIEEWELAKKAEKQLVDTTYDILISKWLVDESNIVDFVWKQENKIEELKKERKEYIKKNKVKTWETDDYLDEMETKIKRYENIIKKSKDDEIYKKASKRKKESLPSEEATEYTDWMFNETSKDAVVNYKDDPTKRSQRIVEAIKEWHSIPNTDASYIAMREVLGEGEAYNNYVVARVLLSEGNDVIENVLQKIWVSQVFGNELTEEVIQNMKNMEDLVNVAFSYTKWLKDNPGLLKLFLEKKDLIIGSVDSIEKLWVVNALYNIWYYGENYTTHMKYDIFATRLLWMWYELPKGMTTKSAYQKIGKAIVDNVNFKLWTDWKVQFSEWKKLTLEGKDGQKVVISWDDLRRLMPSFLPANAPFSDFKDVITIAWYDDYLNKLESAVKETKKTAIREYDDIAQRIKGQPEVEEITEESIFDQDKLEALKQMYEKMISDPKADDRSTIFLKAITKQTIDTKKTLLLSSSFDNTADAAENQVKADLYNGLADQNSIPVTTWIKGYKPSDIVTEDLAKNTEFVLIEWGYIDDDMWDFINKVNEIRASNKLAPVTTVKNKMYNKGRFYIKNGELRFSIITSADYNDFVETMLNIGVDYSDLKNPDVPNLLKMYADYVDSAYGGKSPNAQLKKIENLLWLPGKTDSKGRLIIDKEGDIEVDVVALDQYVKDVTSQTWKFRAEVVDLWEKWNNVKNLNEDSIFMIANRFADEVWLPGVKDIKGINMENAKELLFAAMYNTDVVKSIQAKYAFLKTCGITGVARESDKIAVINYLFNKQLRLSWYNMWVLQSDDFIRKIVNGEDVSDDVRANLFMKANAGNPDFLALAWDTPEEKMATLINNVKESIQFDNLKNELSFPTTVRYQEAWHWTQFDFDSFNLDFVWKSQWSAHWWWVYVTLDKSTWEKYAKAYPKTNGRDNILLELDIPDEVRASTPTWLNYLDEGANITEKQLDSFVDEAKRFMTEEQFKTFNDYIDNFSSKGWIQVMNLYFSLSRTLWSKQQASEFLQLLWYDGISYIKKWEWKNYVLFDPNKITIKDKTKYQEFLNEYRQNIIKAQQWLESQNVINKKTVKQLAKDYWIDIKVVDKIMTPQWRRAWWMYSNWLITLSENLIKSTAPHELLHACFDMVDAWRKSGILDWIKKLWWDVSDLDAEERLADWFAEYFNTWKISFDTKTTKTFREKVMTFFKKIKEFITWISKNKEEIQRMFDDIIWWNIEVAGRSLEWPVRYSASLWDIKWENFKKRFWDWENDPDNASKVVNEDGSPKVVYHGTPNASFTEFRGWNYFTENREYAAEYQNPNASSISYKSDKAQPWIYAVYLNIKKPFDTREPDARKIFEEEYFWKYWMWTELWEKWLPDWMDWTDLQEFIEKNHPEYDGLILDEWGVWWYGEDVVDRWLSYVPFKPNQIKSATDNVWTYSTLSDDIRFQLAEWWVQYMPHEWEQAVYRMLVDPTNGKTDWVLWSMEKMWLYLWMGKEIKNAAAKEMDFVLTAIEEYKKAIQDLVENWGKYDRAIELKQELQFVLSTINNKVILPSYIWLVPEDTLKEIAQLWVSWIPLNISDTQQAIDQFMNSIDNIEKQYKNLSSLVKKSKEEVSKMDNAARQEKMIEEGLVDIIWPDGSLTTLRIDDVVSSYIDYVQKSWLKFSDDVNQLLQINVWDLKYLSHRQKYDVFKKLSLIKKYTDFYSMYKTIYYKQHTLLATSNFFDNYKLWDDWYPQIIQTLKAKIITDANVSDRDIQLMAQNIYDNLMVSSFTEWKSIDGAEKMKFGSNFEPPSQEMIKQAVSEQVDMIWWLTERQKERIQNYMESIFNPYTELKSIPADCEAMIKKVLGQSLDSVSTSLWFTKDQAISEFWDLIISQRDWRPLTVNEMFTMSDSQEMLPSYIRNGNNQKVEISKLTWWEDVKDINKQVNKINDIIIATVNDFNVVTDLDKATAKDSLRWVAWLFRQNTLLNQIARAEDRLYSEGNEISALIKDVVFDKRILWVRKRWLAELFPRIMWWQLRKAYIEETWDWIKAAYNRYFNMSLWDLERMDLNDIADNVEWIWLRLALYFKRLWDMLGSADWVRWVTTDIDINKALYHIWDCVNFVSSSAWVLSLASGMNNFQILKFVKVIKDWEWFHPFLRKISQASSGRWFSKDWEELADETTRALLGTGLEAWDINRFNELFNWNYDVKQAQRIIFALWGFQRDNRWNRYIGRFLQRASKSSFLTRAISSYPFWILPVPLQQIWYSVKRSWLTRWLGVSASDLSEFHLLRKRENVLVWWYFEFTDAFSPKVREQIEEEIRNKFGSIENFLWSIWHQYSQLGDQAIVDNLQKLWWFLKWDDSATMFKKIKAIWQNPEARKLLDNTKENANNIIDWLNSSAMKDIVFAQAIMRNNVYKFYSPEDYYLFMKDPTISAEFKRKVKDEIIIQANRSFIDTMWLGWGATRAVVARNGFGDAMLQLHNFINFRWQWWTTIARNFVARMKQIFWIWGYIMKNIGKPWLADEISERFIRTPEMQNFLSDIYSVAYWGIHAQREATRNYEDSELQPLSFFDKYNTLSWLAMFIQWLSSWGRGRIVSSGFEWFMRSLGRDLSIGDSLWVAWVEMLESFFSNFGRQFKFEKFVSDWLMVSIEQSWSDEFDIWWYFIEQLGNMSKGSLRYMANESWYNNYSDLPDNTWPRRYVAGTKTNKNNIYLSHRDAYDKVIAIKEWIKRWWDTEDDGIDMTNVISDIMWQWTFWKTCENLYNSALATYYLAKWDAESKAALSKMSKDVAEINEFSTAVEETVQWQQLRDMWYYIPQDAQGVEDLGKKFIRHNAPWGSNSFTRMQKYSMWLELDNVRDDEAFFYETIWQEGAKRIVDKVDDVYHDKNSSAWDKRRAMIDAVAEELERHEDDPLYPELQTFLYKGIMSFQYDWYVDQAYEKYKAERNAGIKKKKDYIAEDKTDWLKYEGNEYRLKQEFVLNHNVEWSNVDVLTYKSAAFKEMIRLDEGKFNPFVERKVGKDEEGKDTLEPTIKSKYRINYDDTIKALRLFEAWEWQAAIQQMSLMTKKVDYEDSTWVAWAILLNDQFQLIDEMPNLTRADKAMFKFQLLNNNYDIARKVIENREIFGDDSYIVNLVSEMRYNVDQSLTEAIQEVAQSYEAGNDDKSSWGSGATLSKLKASKIALDKLSWSDRGNRGNGWTRGKPSFNYTIDTVHWSEFLRWVNNKKKASTNRNAIDTSVGTYKEIPLVTQPKDLWKPKKIKGEKKKVKNTKKK